MPDAGSHDIKILATDIDTNMIAEGREGVYGKSAISAVPAALRDRWFVPVRSGTSEGWGATEDLRNLVSFRELNLIGRWPMQGKFQAIFCRNVVIYFEEETQNKIWSRYADQLIPGGWLYIGHSERLTGPASTRFKAEGITTYRLAGA
jgi:chemotaxis protein methyltransferase CheR